MSQHWRPWLKAKISLQVRGVHRKAVTGFLYRTNLETIVIPAVQASVSKFHFCHLLIQSSVTQDE